MLLTWILGGVAVGAVIYAIHTRRDLIEAREEYDNRCKELTNALGEVGRMKFRNNSLAEDNKWLEERIREYTHLITTGYRNLKVKVLIIPDSPNLPKYSIVVVGQDTMNPNLEFVVKGFTADNEEDREFAIREAEELIETINKF